MVDLNMQVACNVRASDGLPSISLAIYGIKSTLSSKLNNEDLHYVYCPKNIIIMMKGRNARWVRDVTRMGR